MARRFILPLGFINRITENEGVFILTKPGDCANVRPNTPVTVWRYSPAHLAIAKVRGQVTAVGYSAARFTVSESQADPRWPEGENPLRTNAPVYLALPESFEPDPSRMLSHEEAEALPQAQPPGEE